MKKIQDSNLHGLHIIVIGSMIALIVLLVLDFLNSVGVIGFRLNFDWPSIICAVMSTCVTLFFAIESYKQNKHNNK